MGDRAKGMNVDSPVQRDPDTAADAARLRGQIAATRADIEQTVSEIGQRLTPAAMAAEAADRLRDTAADAGRKATAVAREVADRAVATSRETARQVASQSRATASRLRIQSRDTAEKIKATARDHPVITGVAAVAVALAAAAITYTARAQRRKVNSTPLGGSVLDAEPRRRAAASRAAATALGAGLAVACARTIRARRAASAAGDRDA